MLGKFFDKFCFNTIFLFVAVLVLGGLQLSSVFKEDEGGKMTGPNPVLPKTVGLWTRSDSPKVVTAENIFDYMNGAGELYLGYRFDRLDVYEYKADSQKEILVELYFMKTSDDAFGLLSLDWGGDVVEHDLDWTRALYGEGLLRLWSETGCFIHRTGHRQRLQKSSRPESHEEAQIYTLFGLGPASGQGQLFPDPSCAEFPLLSQPSEHPRPGSHMRGGLCGI